MNPPNPTLYPWAIEADHLRWQAPDGNVLWTLDDATLQVPAGAVVGLVGRNGAGKSTLLRMLLGLSLPHSGRSALLGCDSRWLDDATRERLGYVAQTPDLFERLGVWDHIEWIGRAYAGYDPDRAMRLAVQLQLPLRARCADLSLGDQQKLAVVMALAHDPDLVLMDEPVASLDPLSRRDFMRALFQRRDDTAPARTVLVSSHLLSDLERVVTHVAFIREGRVQLFEEWDALRENYLLIDASTDAGGAGMPCSPQAVRHRCADGRRLVDARLGAGGGRHLTLDELFVALNS